MPFSIDDVFDLQVPSSINDVDHSFCFYLRTIVCEPPRLSLTQRPPPRFASTALVHAMMLYAVSRHYTFTYSIFKKPLFDKLRSIGFVLLFIVFLCSFLLICSRFGLV